MTEKEEKSETGPATKHTGSRTAAGQASAEDAGPEIEFPPTLLRYFEDTRVTPSAFFRVLRRDEVKRFRSDDQDAASKLMTALDPEGERLWALMSQPSWPDAVDAWLWGAAQTRLRGECGEAFDPQDHDAARIFASILTSLSSGLRSDQKEEKKRAETWLRIGICWLTEKRGLKAWQIAEGLRPIFFAELKSASRVALRAVQKGKVGELRLAVAVAGLGEQMVKAAAEERDRERHTAADLRLRLDDARATIERLRSDLEDAAKTTADREATISKLEHMLAAERLHWGHDLTEARAAQKVLLGERLRPLLEDAVDAFEIDPPALGTALRRVRAALAVIEEARE